MLFGVAHLGREVLLDNGAALVAHLGDVVAAGVLDRLVEGERDCARRHVEGSARHHFVAAVDGDGNNGELKLKGELERAVLERAHEAGAGAPPLGEDDYRHAAVQFLLGCRHGVPQALRGVGIYHDVASHAACGTDDGYVGDALAHHPLEIVAQETVDREDVIGSLMVGDKHITCLVVNEFATLDAHAHQVYPAPHPGPPLSWVITPIILVKQAANDGD